MYFISELEMFCVVKLHRYETRWSGLENVIAKTEITYCGRRIRKWRRHAQIGPNILKPGRTRTPVDPHGNFGLYTQRTTSA